MNNRPLTYYHADNIIGQNIFNFNVQKSNQTYKCTTNDVIELIEYDYDNILSHPILNLTRFVPNEQSGRDMDIIRKLRYDI